MKFIARLEQRFGRFAIPNLTLIFIIGQALIYAIDYLRTSQGGDPVIGRIAFVPAHVMAGEVWRIVTFLFMPPQLNPIFALIYWMVFNLMGTALENQWGIFRYNLFLFIGAFASMAAAFLVPNMPATNMFLYNSVFLAFAFLFPDFVFHLFFILPIRVKWLAWIDWLLLGIACLTLSWDVHGWISRVMILASVTNFFLFFGQEIWYRFRMKQRRIAFESRLRTSRQKKKYRHKCTVCGITNLDDPKMQFRYCSKCDGHLGYCMEHIHNHEHVTAKSPDDAD
ncbi:MAG: hypothetical protein JW829_19390 [Pirellulales bacterium]|nr:hypothetical protein [Pirellulales bacterium]